MLLQQINLILELYNYNTLVLEKQLHGVGVVC